MKIQTSKIECPECGCTEIRREYDRYGYMMLSLSCNQDDEELSDECTWCNCLNCGLVFSPVREAIAV